MTTRYQKRHYEDIAKILNSWAGTIEKDGKPYYFTHLHLCRDFAELFMNDNPPHCQNCGITDSGGAGRCAIRDIPHVYVRRFDYERFMTACGVGD
jgi:hypothetical protein